MKVQRRTFEEEVWSTLEYYFMQRKQYGTTISQQTLWFRNHINEEFLRTKNLLVYEFLDGSVRCDGLQ